MSIPVFTPRSRAHFIEWRILPRMREGRVFRSARQQERNHLQAVFLFWLLLFVFTQIGFLSALSLYNSNRSNGLRVTLPHASEGKIITDKSRAVEIWISRNAQCLINDKAVKNSRHVSTILGKLKSETHARTVYLRIDRDSKMDFPRMVINAIHKAGFERIVFAVDELTGNIIWP